MMFGWFGKRSTPSEAPRLRVDIHSHLTPGIDDGSQSMEESLALLRRFVELGYSKVITTPHVMADTYRNTPEIITSGLRDLREAAVEEELDIEIEAAAEYYFDDGFVEKLHAGDALSFGENYLLFETSYVSKPIQTEGMIFEIAAAGYTPVMAHPERYRYIKDPATEYARFKELGVLFQCNLTSFGGHYGKSAKQKAQFLSRNGMIDLLSSDAHSLKHLDALEGVLRSREYTEIFLHNDIGNNKL